MALFLAEIRFCYYLIPAKLCCVSAIGVGRGCIRVKYFLMAY